jgi:elongation factor G
MVDVAVNLSDGSYHTVDSSDMAFQMAAKIAMKEGAAACAPVVLEPIMKVEIYTPSEATARITALVPQRRGQILGYDAQTQLARLGCGRSDHAAIDDRRSDH